MASQYLEAFTTKATSWAEAHPYLAVGASLYVAFLTISRLQKSRRSGRYTKLSGPPSTNYLLGHFIETFQVPNAGAIYAGWASIYGPVYKVPHTLGGEAVVVTDPKALTSILSRDASAYSQAPNFAAFFAANFGHNVLTIEGEHHKRQRRALSAGFSVSAIRNLMPVYYETVYRVAETWNSEIKASNKGAALINVSEWMNNIALDSIGKGGFSHDFGTTKGQRSHVSEMFEAFGNISPNLIDLAIFLFGARFPLTYEIPTRRKKIIRSLAKSFEEIAMDLYEKAKKEKETGINEGIDKSIIGALVRAESASSNIRMDIEEIRASINLFMIAGYETTSISLSWALIELARNPHIQKKVREEVSRFVDEDPTYEQLGSDLPYLTAVMHETLRLHPSLQDVSREANDDDVLPLSQPFSDANGNMVDSVSIPKGTDVLIPIHAINKMDNLWGGNGSVFDPERWLNNSVSAEKAAEIQGYQHLLTFLDGPRMCLGRLFALTEIKAVLAVLVRDFTFELPDGPDTKFETHLGLLPRPKVAGEKTARVPLLIKRVN